MSQPAKQPTTQPMRPGVDQSGYVAVERPRYPVPGETLSDAYRIEEVIGAGGMGVVMRARDLHLHRDVAIKTIRIDRVSGDRAKARFLTEARALARVTHRNVVQIHTFGELDGAPYFVMEHVAGRTLESLIVEGTLEARPLDASIEILDCICEGLGAIHGAGIVHGDVKPANVLVSRGGRIVLTDMGLARLLSQSSDDGHAWGTLDYMAPELIAGLSVPPHLLPRADIYSLGCLAFEMLTGRPPFAAPTDAELMKLHLREPPPRPSEVSRRVPPELDAAVQHALQKSPADRPETPKAFIEALRSGLRASRLGRPLILIADDHPDQRIMLVEYLSRVFPYAEIQAVSDGMRALEAIDRQIPAVTIIDLDMPGVNGIELTACMRGRRETREVPIIVLTGVGRAADWRTLHGLGVTHFLVKPVLPSRLVSILRDLVEARA